MTSLPIVTDGPCAGHGCDGCRTCQRGHCCRRDDPDYRLPKLGDWDGPIYGELGRLADHGDTVTCHACGGDFISVAGHAYRAHDLTAAEYRAIFGLGIQRALVAADLRRRHSELRLAAMAEGRGIDIRTVQTNGFKTTEQALQASERSRQRLESQRRLRETSAQSLLDYAAEHPEVRFGPGPRSEEIRRALSAAMRGKTKTPEHRARIAESVRAAHARRKAAG
jgi:hypothetical protein